MVSKSNQPNWYWLSPDWCDLKIEQFARSAIAEGTVRAPQWRWKAPKAYNGFSGEERIAGWQIVKVAIKLKLIPYPSRCSICLKSPAGQMHNENYARPIQAKPICPSCHRILHQRLKHPARWQKLQELHGYTGAWFVELSNEAIDEDL